MKAFFIALRRLPARFLRSSNAVTRSAPHIRDSNNVQRMWNYFVLASMPAWLIGLWSLGHQTNMAIADFQLKEVTGWRGWLLGFQGLRMCFGPNVFAFVEKFRKNIIE